MGNVGRDVIERDAVVAAADPLEGRCCSTGMSPAFGMLVGPTPLWTRT
jgi:hypothetical protein